MVPGIDPKVDIAFKKVFGTPQWRNLTMALIDAVLQPPPWERLVDLELLNPYSEKMKLDDKLSILDIKARDDQGRLFNLEMQMVAGASLPQRFLYYWAQLYAHQLAEGEDHDQLCRTISICFVNGRLFPDDGRYHRQFRLLDREDHVEFTADCDVHLLELPKFERELGELRGPLDSWLYFFKNGDALDADALPQPLAAGEVRQAMEVLKMFSQDEMERELYQGRLKARRDVATRENMLRRAQEQLAQEQQHRREAEERRAEAEERRVEAEERRAEAEERRVEAEERRAEAEERLDAIALVSQIQLLERVLERRVTDTAELVQRDVAALQELAQRLESEFKRTP